MSTVTSNEELKNNHPSSRGYAKKVAEESFVHEPCEYLIVL